MKKTLQDTFNRIGGNRLNEAHAWERQPGKPLPTMADVKAAHESTSLQEDEYDDDEDGNDEPWESSDGWDENYFDDNGVTSALDLAAKIAYEIRNARRGSYAVGEDSIFAMRDALIELQEMLGDAIGSIKSDTKGKPDAYYDDKGIR